LKVKIAYTVDLEEVLTEVNVLCNKALTSINEVKEAWLPIVTDNNLTEHVSSVDELRRKMLHVDLILADVDGILRSYMETKFGPAKQENTKELLNG